MLRQNNNGYELIQSDDSQGGRFEFRPMREEDIEIVYDLDKIISPAPWSRQAFYNELENSKADSYVVTEADKIIAYAVIWWISDELHIGTIGTAREFRHQGIASRILSNVFAKAHCNSVKKAYLEVGESNLPALALYTKFGFNREGLRKNYYTQNRENALLMSVNLG